MTAGVTERMIELRGYLPDALHERLQKLAAEAEAGDLDVTVGALLLAHPAVQHAIQAVLPDIQREVRQRRATKLRKKAGNLRAQAAELEAQAAQLGGLNG